MKGNVLMRTGTWLWIILLLSAPLVCGADETSDSEMEAERKPETITVVVRHRVIAAFADTIEVAWGTGEQYWIGDTEYSLEIVRFVADFGINQTGEIIERSDEAHNPTCQVVIYNEGVEEDRVWSFFGTGAPHFRRESILAVDMISFPWHGKVLTGPIPREAE